MQASRHFFFFSNGCLHFYANFTGRISRGKDSSRSYPPPTQGHLQPHKSTWDNPHTLLEHTHILLGHIYTVVGLGLWIRCEWERTEHHDWLTPLHVCNSRRDMQLQLGPTCNFRWFDFTITTMMMMARWHDHHSSHEREHQPPTRTRTTRTGTPPAQASGTNEYIAKEVTA